MLQTIQAKTDTTAQSVQPKDKDVPAKDLKGGLKTFYSQFMAAMPPLSQVSPEAEAAQPRDREPGQSLEAPPKGGQERPDARMQNQRVRDSEAPGNSRKDEETSEAGDLEVPQDGGTARAKAATRNTPAKTANPAPSNPISNDQDEDQATPDGTAATAQDPAAAAAAAQDPAAAAAAGAAAVAPVAVLATTAQTATTTTAATTPAKAAGPEGIATAKAQAQASSTGNSATQPQAAPDGISAAKAQAALEQLLPDGKLPFQFGDPAAQPTTKPALSEFMNQLQAEIQTPSFKGVGSASGEAAPLAAPGNQAGPDLQALMPAVQAAALSMGQPAKEASPSNPSLTGNFTPSEAVGAAAVPGASGAVRVTASTAPESTAPTRRENPMSQVDSSIRWLIKNKEQSAELQLHPEALGRVQVKITVEGTEVHAKLWASEASAMPILQEHRAFLESSLKAQGLTLGSFDLQHGQQQQDQSPLPRPEPFSPPLPFNPAPVNAEPDTPSAVKLAATGSNRIEIVA